jgi:hypothetical protein
MDYFFDYINKNMQEMYVDYALIIVGKIDDNVVESYRIEKSFNLNEYVVNKEFLDKEAQVEIERIVSEKSNLEGVA